MKYWILSLLTGLSVLLPAIFFAHKKMFEKYMQRVFKDLSLEVLRGSHEDFLTLAKERFNVEHEKASGEFDSKRKEISLIVGELEKKLAKYEELMRSFERDRDSKYGSLTEQIKSSAEVVVNLHKSTARLNEILGNTKLRGQWGERLAEDVLRHAGFEENIHYVREKVQATVNTRPDFTFLLPQDLKVNMDVKFPLANYLEAMNAEDERDRKKFEQMFLRDVRQRIKELDNREYINTKEGTLSFVLLFIPNEHVYGYIHNNDPQLADDALARKVILCSPFTLYAVLSVLREAVRNFRIEKTAQDIAGILDDFTRTYEIFRNRFDQLGQSLEKTQILYNDLSLKSFRMLNSKVKKIEALREGKEEYAAVEPKL